MIQMSGLGLGRVKNASACPSRCSRLALTAKHKYPEAIGYFKKALMLDPENDTYKSNLKIAEQKQKEASSPVSWGT